MPVCSCSSSRFVHPRHSNPSHTRTLKQAGPAPADLLEESKADTTVVAKLRLVFSRVLDPHAPSLIQNLKVDPHAVAQLLLQYFRSLPQPVVPSRYFYTLLRVHSIEHPRHRIVQLRVLLYQLPPISRAVLLAVCEYLMDSGLSASAYAARLAECFFRAPISMPTPAAQSAQLPRLLTDFVLQCNFMTKIVNEPCSLASASSSATASVAGQFALEALARYDFAGGQYLLALRKGDHVRLLDVKLEPGWLLASKGSVVGYVPETYVELIPVLPTELASPSPSPFHSPLLSPARPVPTAATPTITTTPAAAATTPTATAGRTTPHTRMTVRAPEAPKPLQPPPAALLQPTRHRHTMSVGRAPSPMPTSNGLAMPSPPSPMSPMSPSVPAPAPQPGSAVAASRARGARLSLTPSASSTAAGTLLTTTATAPPIRPATARANRHSISISTPQSPSSVPRAQLNKTDARCPPMGAAPPSPSGPPPPWPEEFNVPPPPLPPTAAAAAAAEATAGATAAAEKGAWKAKLSAEELEKLPKLMEQRVKRATEIMTSEQTYLEFLKTMTELFVKPLKEKPMGLTSDDRLELFSNVEVLERCHEKLLEKIEARVKHWDDDSCLGDVFLTDTGFIKLYRYYVNNYEQSLTALARCRKKSAEFDEYVKRWELTPKMRNSRLIDFLVAPVQRVMRYSMLLEELLKKTPPQHPDEEPLRSAVAMTKGMANFINEIKRDVENSAAFVTFLGRLKDFTPREHDALLRTSKRALLREGDAALNTASARVRLFLFTDLLFVTKPPKHDTLRFKQLVPLARCTVVHDGTQRYRSFTVEAGGAASTLLLESEADAAAWFYAVFRASQDCKDLAVLEHSSRGVRDALSSEGVFSHATAQQRHQQQLQRLQQLADTEAAFGDRLARAWKTFLQPLKDAADTHASILKPEKVARLCGGMGILVTLQPLFVAALRDRAAEWARSSTGGRLSDLLEQHLKYLRAYTPYLAHFEGMLEAYRDAESVAAFQFWLARAEAATRLALEKEIAAPLDHFSELFFALQEIVLCRDRDSPDSEPLAAAMEKIKACKEEFVLLATKHKATPPIAAALERFTNPAAASTRTAAPQQQRLDK